MTPFAQAVRELGDEMEARAIEALAMAQVQPEAAEMWTAQAGVVGYAAAAFKAIQQRPPEADAPIFHSCVAYWRREASQQIAALVERRRQEANAAVDAAKDAQ